MVTSTKSFAGRNASQRKLLGILSHRWSKPCSTCKTEMWFIETLSRRIFWLQILRLCILNFVISDGLLIQLTREGLPFAERSIMLRLSLSTKSHTMKRSTSGPLASYALSFWLDRHRSLGRTRMTHTLISQISTCRRQTIRCVNSTPLATMPSTSASRSWWRTRTSAWAYSRCGDTHGSTRLTRWRTRLPKVRPHRSMPKIRLSFPAMSLAR